MGRDRAITSAFGCDWAISVRGETVSMRFRYLGPVRAPSRPENGMHPGNGVTDCSGDATKGRIFYGQGVTGRRPGWRPAGRVPCRRY